MKKFLILFVSFIPLFGFSQIKNFQTDSIPKNTQRAVLINNQSLKNALRFNPAINEMRNSTYVFYNNQLIVYDRFSDLSKSAPHSKIKVLKDPDSIAEFLKNKIEVIIVVE